MLAQQSVNVLISVQGYYTAGAGDPAPGGYVPVPPRRLVDTRIGTGLPQAKLALGSTTAITVGGLASVTRQPQDTVTKPIRRSLMRYPNFMPPDPEWAEEPDHVDDEGPSITIMYIADEDVWQAV